MVLEVFSDLNDSVILPYELWDTWRELVLTRLTRLAGHAGPLAAGRLGSRAGAGSPEVWHGD